MAPAPPPPARPPTPEEPDLSRRPSLGHGGVGDRRGVSHSRSTSALCCSRAFSAGAAMSIFASVSASMLRNATASGMRGLSRYGEFFIVVCLTVWLEMPCPRAGGRRGLSTCRETGGLIRPRLRGLSRRTPDTRDVTPVSGLKHSRFGVESATRDHAAGWRLGARKDAVNGRPGASGSDGRRPAYRSRQSSTGVSAPYQLAASAASVLNNFDCRTS
jgi:hypothetical protein